MYLDINMALNEPVNYSVISQINMQVNDRTVLRQQLEQEISCELTAKDKNGVCSILLKHTDHLDKVPAEFGNTQDVSQYINFPYENLHLKLFLIGEIKEILNQEDIAEKWERIKKTEEFRQLLEYVDEERFIKELDSTYKDSLEYICATPRYITFFPPVYQTQRYHPDPYVRYDLSYNSIIFVGNKIHFTSQLEPDRTENGFVFFQSKTVKWDTDKRRMGKLYKEGYASVIQSPMEGYSFEYEAEHKYERQTGRLVQANAVFREKANENLIYENKIVIQLKKD